MERLYGSSEPSPLVLDGRTLTIGGVVDVARRRVGVSIAPEALGRLEAERRVIDEAVDSGRAVYGVTTGLGARVGQRLDSADLAEMSLRTLRGRANAVGPPLGSDATRAVLVTRANQLARGGSGVQPAVARTMMEMLDAGVEPQIPSIGSISAGDLCQLAHVGLAVAGEGWVILDGRRLPAAEALEASGLAPVTLGPKDGLVLCNSSALSAGLAALAVADTEALAGHAYAVAGLSFEGFRGNTGPARADVLAAHGAPGEAQAGSRLREQLTGGLLLEAGFARRLQDPLSWRCVPQVHGALESALDFARPAVVAELNGSSDNPLTLGDEVISTGNFEPATLALALDTVALALHQVAALSASRTARLLVPGLTGLPANLSPYGLERSGFAPLVKVSQALLAQLRRLAVPVSDDPRTGATEVEDTSTNAALGATRLGEMAGMARLVLAIEALLAAQAVELAAPARVAPRPASLLAAIRERVPALDDDRPCGSDIETVAELLPLA